MTGGAIRGVVGRIEWRYFVAAAIEGYTVTRSADNQWSLLATVIQADAFKLRQRPLVFAAPYDAGVWRWPIQSLDVGPNHIRATLGEPLP